MSMMRGHFETVINWATDFYGVEMRAKIKDYWYDVFKYKDQSDFRKAFDWHIANVPSNQFPSIGHINKAFREMEEEERNKPPKYPEFSVMWVRIVKYFPDQQDYEFYPPEDDVKAWEDLYDKVVMIPSSQRNAAVQEAMKELEAKYKNG